MKKDEIGATGRPSTTIVEDKVERGVSGTSPGMSFCDPLRLADAAKKLGLRLVILYGSRATGSPSPTPESDLDIAVLDDRPPSSGRFWILHGELSLLFDQYNVDLALLSTADPLFRYEILRKGILLHGDPNAFCQYRAFAYRDFIDSEDLRNLEDVLFHKRMEFIRRELHDKT